MKAKEGSTFVEAAFVFPLVVLITAGLIDLGSGLHCAVKEDSLRHRQQAEEEVQSLAVPTEAILRGRWVLR
ncbi:MAG: pilus assembly protein [Firmicutes bacterium]|nr:pilus assembly protein [Bacillota bacterium]